MYRLFIKRFFDIVLSLTALVILSPVFIVVIISLLFSGEHLVFYFQERVGHKNRIFNIWKFVTMVKNSENLGNGMLTVRNDPRVLPIGKFLRKTKINELPQLINILKGDMSIVGPRPLAYKTFEPYPDHVKERIYNVKPGLTGLGSIVFRDEERLLTETDLDPLEFATKCIPPYKGSLELWYQDHLSAWTDFMIVFLTAWVIFFPKSQFVYKIFSTLPPKPDFLV